MDGGVIVAEVKKCPYCPHREHAHPTSPYAWSSICGVEKYPGDADPEPCRCRAGKAEVHEGIKFADGYGNSYWNRD